MTNPMSREELLETVCQFTDDYIDEWAADGNELDKLHEITDKHVEHLESLLAQARAEGAVTALQSAKEIALYGCIENGCMKNIGAELDHLITQYQTEEKE